MCLNTIQTDVTIAYAWREKREKNRWIKRRIWDKQTLNLFLESLPTLSDLGFQQKRKKVGLLCNNYLSATICFRRGGKFPIPKGTLRFQSSFPCFLDRRGGKKVPGLCGWGEVLQLAEKGLHRAGPHKQPSPGQLPCTTVVASVGGETTTTAWHDHQPPRGLGIGYQIPTAWEFLSRVVEWCLLLLSLQAN